MDRLDDLTVLVEVVDCGSLSAAGERLGLSASAVSRRLSQLEARLGTRLIARTTRRIALTDAGASFCLRARAILAALDEAEQSLTEMSEAPRGTLRITMPVVFGQRHVAPLLPAYMLRYPAVTVEAQLSDRTVRLVDEGFDLAIRIGRLAESSLIARRLRPMHRILVAAPAYLERRGVPRALADLPRHDCLLFLSGGGRQEWEFSVDGRRETVRVSGSLQSDNLTMLHQAALGGVGIARLADFIVRDDLAAGRLVPLLPDHELTDEGVYAVYPQTRHVSPKVRTFIDHLLAGLETIAPAAWRHPPAGGNRQGKPSPAAANRAEA